MGNSPTISERVRGMLPDRDWFADLNERFIIQSRVVHAVIMREARTRYGDSDIGYLWAIIDPLIEISILMALFTWAGRTGSSAAPLPVFFAMGLLPFGFLRGCIQGGASVVRPNQALLTYPQVKIFDLVLGRAILEFATMAVVYLSFMAGTDLVMGISFTNWYDEPLNMALAICSLFIFGTALSFLSCGLARLFPVWTAIWGYISRPLWFLSAVFYSLEALPQGPRQYIIYNPLAHAVEWFRSASSPAMESSVYSVSFIYITAFISLLLGIAIDRMLTSIGFSDKAN
jgi:capsular polysaccharide transport system permease protein